MTLLKFERLRLRQRLCRVYVVDSVTPDLPEDFVIATGKQHSVREKLKWNPTKTILASWRARWSKVICFRNII